MCVCVCVSVCVCVCVCVGGWVGGCGCLWVVSRWSNLSMIGDVQIVSEYGVVHVCVWRTKGGSFGQ